MNVQKYSNMAMRKAKSKKIKNFLNKVKRTDKYHLLLS